MYEELTVDDPDVEAPPIDAATDEGWATVAAPLEFSEPVVSRVMDGVQRYIANASDLREPNLWILHSGATYALTHQFRGGDGSALQQYTRLANDLLFNPEATIDRVEAAYEREFEANCEDQQSLDGSTARIQLKQVREDLGAKADQFEQREERLRERFTDDR